MLGTNVIAVAPEPITDHYALVTKIQAPVARTGAAPSGPENRIFAGKIGLMRRDRSCNSPSTSIQTGCSDTDASGFGPMTSRQSDRHCGSLTAPVGSHEVVLKPNMLAHAMLIRGLVDVVSYRLTVGDRFLGLARA